MATSTYCDLPRELDLASRLTLAEHIIDALARELNDIIEINSSAWRREGNGWGSYIYATVKVFDTRDRTTSRGIRFRVTDTYLGIQGGSANASRFARGGEPPADAPLAPAADIPQLAELNRELKRIGTPIVNTARAQDTEEALSLIDPDTSRLGAVNAARLGELQRHAPDSSAQTTTTSIFRLSQQHADSALDSTEPANALHSRLRRAPIVPPSVNGQIPNRRQTFQPAQTARQPRQADLQALDSSFGSPVDAQPRPDSSTAQLSSLRQNLASSFGNQTAADPPVQPQKAPRPTRHLIERPPKRARSDPPPTGASFLPDNDDEVHNDAADSTQLPSTAQPRQYQRSDSQQTQDQPASEPPTALLPRIAHALATYLPCTAEDLLAAMLAPPPATLMSFYDAQSQNAPSRDQAGQRGQRET